MINKRTGDRLAGYVRRLSNIKLYVPVMEKQYIAVNHRKTSIE